MKLRKKMVILLTVIGLQLITSTGFCFAQSQLLKKGMSGQAIVALQDDLKRLGHYSYKSTGYFGDITLEAVKDFQKVNGLKVDGVVGNDTLGIIKRVLKDSSALSSRGLGTQSGYLVPWFGEAEKIFSIGTVANVYDVDTGKSFNIKRTFGYNHADCETLTKEDTAIMKEIYGGSWSWNRRAVILTINGKKIAASMAGMPHAGVDSKPSCAYVSWRSGGFGAGVNLDSIKGNGMDGHFDVHFLNSRTHATNSVNRAHQSMVKKAAEVAARIF